MQAELVLETASCIRYTLELVHSASLRLKAVTSLEEALLVSRQITKTDHRASNCFSLCRCAQLPISHWTCRTQAKRSSSNLPVCSRLMVFIERAHVGGRESALIPAGATKEGIARLPRGPAKDWPGVSWENPCSICLEKLRPESTVSCLQVHRTCHLS